MTTRDHRARLPQLADRVFLTDGGIETTLIHHQRIDLPVVVVSRLVRAHQRVGCVAVAERAEAAAHDDRDVRP